jgi:hypothetical protein
MGRTSVSMPKLPNIDNAIIDRRKIVDYLLARGHPTGRAKAAFFESLGFHPDWPEVLEMRLRIHAHDNEISEAILTEFGRKFIISGPVKTPIGTVAKICVVWFVEHGEVAPRLVTAFPD